MPESSSQPSESAKDKDSDRLHKEAAELLGGVARGDRDAFEKIYDRFSGALLALCLTMLNDRAEAEDTLQEVFLIVWGRASKYDPALGKAVSWLMTVTRNKCLDRIRSTKRKRIAMENAKEEFLVNVPMSGPADPLDSRDRSDRIAATLCQLPEKQRRAIELAFLKGYTQLEVAELLNEPLGTIKARIRRGMIQMRDLLDQETDLDDTSNEEKS